MKKFLLLFILTLSFQIIFSQNDINDFYYNENITESNEKELNDFNSKIVNFLNIAKIPNEIDEKNSIIAFMYQDVSFLISLEKNNALIEISIESFLINTENDTIISPTDKDTNWVDKVNYLDIERAMRITNEINIKSKTAKTYILDMGLYGNFIILESHFYIFDKEEFFQNFYVYVNDIIEAKNKFIEKY